MILQLRWSEVTSYCLLNVVTSWWGVKSVDVVLLMLVRSCRVWRILSKLFEWGVNPLFGMRVFCCPDCPMELKKSSEASEGAVFVVDIPCNLLLTIVHPGKTIVVMAAVMS